MSDSKAKKVSVLFREIAASQEIRAAFDRRERGVLAFSGGKESCVILHLCRPFRDRLTVIWVNTGAMFPHMVEFVRNATEGFDFVELESDQAAHIQGAGWPAGVVPVSESLWRIPELNRRPEVLVQPWTTCCQTLRSNPIHEFLIQHKSLYTLFIHGQRSNHEPGFAAKSEPEMKFEICAPLADWSEGEVMDYIAAHEITLPVQYEHGVMDSLECWNCTAVTWNASPDQLEARLNFMASRYPDLLKQVAPQIEKVGAAAKAAYEESLNYSAVAMRAADRC